MLEKLRRSILRANTSIGEYIGPERRNRIEIYSKLLSSFSFSRALHLGSGRDKHELRSQLSGSGSVFTFDADRSGLSLNNSLRKIQGDAAALPFEDNTFDLVFSEYVFEHLPNPDAALAEIDRVLSPSGSIVILVPNPLHYYTIIADLTPFWFHKFWLGLLDREHTEIDTFPTQYEWGKLSQLRDTANEYGWEINTLHSFPGHPGYTRPLPILHVVFVLLNRVLSHWQRFHVAYIIHYRKNS